MGSEVRSSQRKSLLGRLIAAYPTTRAAYGRLCRLLSTGQRRAEKGQCILTLDDVYEYADGLIFALLPDGAGHLETIRKHLKAPLYLAVHRLYGGGDRARLNRPRRTGAAKHELRFSPPMTCSTITPRAACCRMW